MKTIQEFLNNVMNMPHLKWRMFRLQQWHKYVNLHPKDKRGNLLDKNTIPDWFMKSKEQYCQVISQHQNDDAMKNTDANDQLELLTTKFELACTKLKVKELEKKVKE